MEDWSGRRLLALWRRHAHQPDGEYEHFNPGQASNDDIESVIGGLNYYIKGEYLKLMLNYARRYAAKPARRHFVLCDAHVPHGGLVRDGKLLLDFHSFPLGIEELPDKPKQAQLRVGYTNAINGRSRGGITPSGWPCERLPYLVEFDNYGRSVRPGEAGMGRFWVWGWDEITLFSQQPENARNDWLGYPWNWVSLASSDLPTVDPVSKSR